MFKKSLFYYSVFLSVILFQILCCFFIFFPLAQAASTYNYTPMENIPGFEGTADFPSYLLAITKFALWTVGIAALFMISWGGFMYMTSAGNTSRAESAKRIIGDAIYGLIVALAAWLLLFVINPDLVNITLSLKPVAGPRVIPRLPTGVCPSPKTPTAACYCANPNIPCRDCVSSCAQVTGINCKESVCYLDSSLLSRLKSANQNVPFRITEPWPPTVKHLSTCHQIGTCADVNTQTGSQNVTDIKKLYDALITTGLHPVYESNNCAPYTAAGVYCKSYPTMTSPSFHVNI